MKGKAHSDESNEKILRDVLEIDNVVLVARNHGMPSKNSRIIYIH